MLRLVPVRAMQSRSPRINLDMVGSVLRLRATSVDVAGSCVRIFVLGLGARGVRPRKPRHTQIRQDDVRLISA